MTETRSFTYEGATVHVVGKRKNMHREQSRRVQRILTESGVHPTTAAEFSSIVAYTDHVEGKQIWHPPSMTAPEAEILAAYQVWSKEGDTDLTDLWNAKIFERASSTTTSPVVLTEDADPN